jgi:hypothetical protein
MTRLTLTLAVWLNLLSLASATITPAREPRPLSREVLNAASRSPETQIQTHAGSSDSDFVVTERTKVLLDGKACKYADVPSHASITRMEVAADKTTVLEIHFRTRK